MTMKKDGIQTRNRKLSAKSKKKRGTVVDFFSPFDPKPFSAAAYSGMASSYLTNPMSQYYAAGAAMHGQMTSQFAAAAATGMYSPSPSSLAAASAGTLLPPSSMSAAAVHAAGSSAFGLHGSSTTATAAEAALDSCPPPPQPQPPPSGPTAPAGPPLPAPAAHSMAMT